MPNIRFKAFFITGPDLSVLSSPQKSALGSYFLRIAEEARWWERNDLKYSFVKCEQPLTDIIVGTFTQQHFLQQHLYDEVKRESSSEIDSFEDRLFIVDLSSNLVLFEWRQFRGKPPLTQPTSLGKFQEVLAEILTAVTDTQIDLEAIDQSTSKEEFLDLFYRNRALYLEVEHFGIFSVSEEVQLVNPSPQLEGALRDLLVHDREVQSIGRLTAEVEPTPYADLRRSAIARGAMHSSEPHVLKYQRDAGQIVVRRQTEQGVFEVSLPADGFGSADEQILIVYQLLEMVRGTDIVRPPLRQASLFDEVDHE